MNNDQKTSMNPEALDLIIDLHLDGERQGPGSVADTRLALALCRLDPARPLAVADIGCGTGASALVLAQQLNARITAVDLAQPFLDRLMTRAQSAGVSDKITALCAPMEDLPFEPGSLDLIWSEGAIYNMGFAAGLEAWRPLLKPNGLMAISEITWLGETRPTVLTDFWEAAYPEITTVAGNIAKLEAAGFQLRGYFYLPSTSWIDEYYTPLLQRMSDFLIRHGGSELAHAVGQAERSEIELYIEHQKHVSYGFYICEHLG